MEVGTKRTILLMSIYLQDRWRVLLFLTHINSLEWQIANSITHKITKVINNEFVEIKNTQKETSQWLVFNKDFEYYNQFSFA